METVNRMLELPALQWRLAVGTGGSLREVIAHSLASYELVFTRGQEFLEAHMVDVKQGVIWSDAKNGAMYISRGVRLENDKIVDVNGEVVLKLGFRAEGIRLGRRVVLVWSRNRIKIIDRLALNEANSMKYRSLATSGDEYTLAALIRDKKRSYILSDTIYGYSFSSVGGGPSSVRARNGCVTVCGRYSCKATNGNTEFHIVANEVEPLAGFHARCVVAVNAAQKWVVMTLGEGVSEAIGVCKEKPTPVYFDESMLIYRCDDKIHVFKSRKGVVEETLNPGSHAGILWPPESIVIDGVRTLVIRDKNKTIYIPVEEYYSVYKSYVLVVSGGWVYSLNFDENDYSSIVFEENSCPIRARLEQHTYRLLKLDVSGDVTLEGLELNASGASMCLKPASIAQNGLSVRVKLFLAPPLVATYSLTLPTPKPRITYRAFQAASDAMVRLGDEEVIVKKGELLVYVEIPPSWLELLEDGEILLLDYEREVRDAQPARHHLVLRCEECVKQPPILAVRVGDSTFEYVVGDVLELRPPSPPVEVHLSSVEPVSGDEVIVNLTLSGLNEVDAIIVDNALIDVDGEDVVKLSTRLSLHEEPRLCACRRVVGDMLLCRCREAPELLESVRALYARVSRVPLGDLLLVDKHSGVSIVNVGVSEPGLLYLEIVDNANVMASRVVRVSGGEKGIALRFSRVPSAPRLARLRVVHREGVIERSVVLVPYRSNVVQGYRVNGYIVACADGYMVYREGSQLLTARCAKLSEDSKLLAVLDSCGYLHKPVMRIRDLRSDVERAVHTARLLARLAGIA